MKAIVVYATRHRNTKRIAEAIAEGLRTKGTVDVFDVEKAPVTFAEPIDVFVAGGPTEAHSVTPPMHAYLDKLGPASLRGIRVASFDTRLRFPKFISGAAGTGIGKKLEAAGGTPLVKPESFIVKGNPAALEPGELERAEAWGVMLAEKVAAPAKVTA